MALTYVGNPDRAEEIVQAVLADSADAEAVVATVERTVRGVGGIDILVVNAVIAPIDG